VRLSIVLHTHMPYVEGFGTWPFGEEWLWEAIATSYLPLLDVLDAHPGKVTLSLTPVLADQLQAPGALERCLTFLKEIRPASHGLDAVDHPELAAQIAYSAARYESAVESLERRGDLLAAFAPHVTWTSAATHAVLPLLATDAGVRLQLETGIASHRRRFGHWDGGFWLPECAHAPWLDELLEEAGVHMTCVDWSDHGAGPHATEAGLFLIGLDRDGIDRVWHESGYPGHGDYRDSHRLSARAHAYYANDGSPYDPARAAARARADAEAWVATFADGPAVVAFDTELFGHHWHEGVTFLQRVLEVADVAPVAIDHASEPRRDPPVTSWGLERDLRTWSRGELAWTQRSAELAALGADPSDRALRELLALQSSDWAFLIDRATAGEYPRERAEAHYQSFNSALAGERSDELRNLAPVLANWAFVQP
jgi:1,4-alpha-glucan branching enzyme